MMSLKTGMSAIGGSKDTLPVRVRYARGRLSHQVSFNLATPMRCPGQIQLCLAFDSAEMYPSLPLCDYVLSVLATVTSAFQV